MSRLAKQESGFTLVELLLVSTLMIVVLGATLTTFESFQKNVAVNTSQNDAQEEVRRAVDYLARELRNLASPTNDDPDSVKRAEPDDLIVQAVARTRPAGSDNLRNTHFVRYCYDEPSSRVVRQRLTWVTEAPPAYPTGAECPSAGWETTDFAAYIVNDDRPLFTYTWNGTDLTTITEVHSSLFVDVNPGRSPAETTISTSVFLRNQNRVPVARFSAAPTADGKILLNGSESADPEERSLRYFWYDADVSTTTPITGGEGIVFEYDPPAFGYRSVFLRVLDPANLVGEAAPETVCVPGGGEDCNAP
jgi:type II secretory pathway pseudopilin PulG